VLGRKGEPRRRRPLTPHPKIFREKTKKRRLPKPPSSLSPTKKKRKRRQIALVERGREIHAPRKIMRGKKRKGEEHAPCPLCVPPEKWKKGKTARMIVRCGQRPKTLSFASSGVRNGEKSRGGIPPP